MKHLSEALVASGRSLHNAGDSMRNHLTGAASGDPLSDWLITDLDNWVGKPDYPATTYGNDVTFNETFDVVRAAKAANIQRIGAVLVTQAKPGGGPGSSVSFTSQNVSGPTGSVAVRVIGPTNPGGTLSQPTNTPWWLEYAWPSGPPTDGNPYPILFSAGFVGDGGGTTDMGYQIYYDPDTGVFSPRVWEPEGSDGDPPSDWVLAKVSNRAAVAGDMEFEWHLNSSYTSLHTTGQTAVYNQSFEGEDVTLYLRARRTGSGDSWINYGAITFNDTRS